MAGFFSRALPAQWRMRPCPRGFRPQTGRGFPEGFSPLLSIS